VADFYNTQIVRFNWGSDREWLSAPFTGIEGNPAANPGIRMEPFPNPYVPGTAVCLNSPGTVLDVYSMDGRRVRRAAGNSWDGKDAAGNPVVAGLYLFRLHAGKASVVSKAVLVR